MRSSVASCLSLTVTRAYACLAGGVGPAGDMLHIGVHSSCRADPPRAVRGPGRGTLALRSTGSHLTEVGVGDRRRRGQRRWHRPTSPASMAAGARREPASVNLVHARCRDVVGPADPSSGSAICDTQPGASAPTCAGRNGHERGGAVLGRFAAARATVRRRPRRPARLLLRGPDPHDLAAKAQPVLLFHQVARGKQRFLRRGAGLELRDRSGARTRPTSRLRRVPAELLFAAAAPSATASRYRQDRRSFVAGPPPADPGTQRPAQGRRAAIALAPNHGALELKPSKCRIDERVAWIVSIRWDALNAWTKQLGEEMIAALDQVAADPDVRAIVSTGRLALLGADLKAGGELGLDERGRPGPLSRTLDNRGYLARRRDDRQAAIAAATGGGSDGCSLALAGGIDRGRQLATPARLREHRTGFTVARR